MAFALSRSGCKSFHLVLSEPFSEARLNSELLMFPVRLIAAHPRLVIPNEVEESLVFRRCLDFARHDKNA